MEVAENMIRNTGYQEIPDVPVFSGLFAPSPAGGPAHG